MALGYLLQPFIQVQDIDGKPVPGARVYVYEADTTDFAVTYSDFEGHRNTNPVITDLLGNCTVVADSDMMYDIVVNDAQDNLMFSKKQVSVNFAGADGSVSIQAGTGISIGQSGNTYIINIDTNTVPTFDDLSEKQDRLVPGANIGIAYPSNTISVVNRKELRAQFPVRIAASTGNTVKMFLDEDFVRNVEILPGTDMKVTLNAEGKQVVSVDTDSTAIGTLNFVANKGNYASGNYNAVFGENSTATGNHNMVGGGGVSVSGNRNAVFGYHNALAYAYSCFAVGSENSATGSSLIIGGQNNTVDGTGTTVCGGRNLASGNFSLLIGELNSVTGNRVFCGGRGNTVDGNHCIVGGLNNSAHGSGVMMHGQGLSSYISYSTVFGQFNDVLDAGTIFAIGNGSTSISRSTALTVKSDGSLNLKFGDGMKRVVPHNIIPLEVGPGEHKIVKFTAQNLSDGYVDLVYAVNGEFATDVSTPVRFEYSWDAMYIGSALSAQVSSIEFALFTDGDTNYWTAFTDSAPIHQVKSDSAFKAFTQHGNYNRLRVRMNLGVAAAAGNEIDFWGGGFVTAEA